MALRVPGAGARRRQSQEANNHQGFDKCLLAGRVPAPAVGARSRHDGRNILFCGLASTNDSLRRPTIIKGLTSVCRQGEFLHLLLALGAGMAAATLYAIGLVLPLVWWSDTRYIIPAVAAMLPPAISCASAGLSAVFSELVAGAPP